MCYSLVNANDDNISKLLCYKRNNALQTVWVYENNPTHGRNSAPLWVGLYHTTPGVDYFHITAQSIMC